MTTQAPNIASGSDLPDRLLNIADRFLKNLITARDQGTVTPKHPITAKRICEAYLKTFKIKISDIDIRALVNYWRQRGKPIASGSSGYFYALKAEELEGTLQHLRDRIKGEQKALDGLETAFLGVNSTQQAKDSQQADLFSLQHPAAQALTKEFSGLQQVA